MTKKLIWFIVHLTIGIVVFGFIKDALASPGALDSSGCHHPKDGAYHCHQKKPGQGLAVMKQETEKARAKRLKANCKTRINNGECAKK